MVGGSLGLTALIGGIILAIVILYAALRNRQRKPHEIRRTEEATRDLYAKVDREDQANDPDPKTF